MGETVLFTLDQLSQLSQIPSPKFVFAHMMAPHPPYILDEYGNAVQPNREYYTTFVGTPKEYISGYTKEMANINQRLLSGFNDIINSSEIKSVIILQTDTGLGVYLNWESYVDSCLNERMAILNAYHLPGVRDDVLYKSISPVNSFRVV